MMKCIFLGLALAGAVGCGKSDKNTCGELQSKVCTGLDAAKCAAWLDGELTGPNGEKLLGSQKNAACSMIVGDKAALEAYVNEAKTKVK